MNALERILRIPAVKAPSSWAKDDFQEAKQDGYRRWREPRRLVGVEYMLFEDAVAAVAPDFHLPPDEHRAAAAVTVLLGGGNCPQRAVVRFVKWERCPVTAGLPNPSEPWVAIWEHGGAVSVEHAQSVDVGFIETDGAGLTTLRRV